MTYRLSRSIQVCLPGPLFDNVQLDFEAASIKELVQLCSHPESIVRADAACSIGDRLRCNELDGLDDDAQSALCGLLQDEFPVALEAAIALAEVQEPQAASVLPFCRQT